MRGKLTGRKLRAGGPSFDRANWLGLVVALAMACPSSLWSQTPSLSLGYPKRLAEVSVAHVVVSDPALEGIAALDKETLEIVWNKTIEGDPLAVAACRNLVLVGNATTHRVEVYRVTGQGKKVEFLYYLGDAQTGYFKLPSDIATDADFQLAFVLDGGEKSIRVFDLKGNYLYALPAAGEVSPLSPTAIAVDEGRQEVLISDYGDPAGSLFGGPTVPARLLIYSYAGSFLAKIDGTGRFGRPQGLAVDALGRIYVAESFLGQILVLERSTGDIVKRLGSFGEAPGQLQLPLDVVLDRKSDDLFVTNTMLQRVEVFRGAGRLP